MRDKILNDLLGAVHDVDVSPVDPRVLWLERRREQVVSGLAHEFSPWALSREAMSGLNIHRIAD